MRKILSLMLGGVLAIAGCDSAKDVKKAEEKRVSETESLEERV